MGIRVLRLSLVVILVLLLVAGALTTLLPNIKEDKMLTLRREIKSQGKPTQDSFTLIMQTYNRTDLLLRLLNHYQAVPYLHKVIVVWNNVGEKGPEELWNSLGPHPVPVNFKAQTTNRMRNRLQVNAPSPISERIIKVLRDGLHFLYPCFSVCLPGKQVHRWLSGNCL